LNFFFLSFALHMNEISQKAHQFVADRGCEK
jgi:hypothetical protein